MFVFVRVFRGSFLNQEWKTIPEFTRTNTKRGPQQDFGVWRLDAAFNADH